MVGNYITGILSLVLNAVYDVLDVLDKNTPISVGCKKKYHY